MPYNPTEVIDRLKSIPPAQKDELTRIIKQSIQGMLTAPRIPQVQGEQTPNIKTVPKNRPTNPLIVVQEDGTIDQEMLIELLARMPV